MSLSTSGRTWDAAAAPAAVALSRRFETAWRAADGTSRRPDLADYWVEAGDAPGVRLALLRTDMMLRWQCGERPDARGYRARFPALAHDAFVALIYEEFCLREEAGETPEPSAFLARYADVASALRRVLDIHGLVGSGTHSVSATGTSTQSMTRPGSSRGVAFPTAGETIAGFCLTEEIGRGAFARVFRALERQLADRPVALKVARTGSREPQTLARLQHTHIVPIYSYRIDPATGLHLLCMPYFGRVTLARVLGEPSVKTAHSGAELVAAIDRLSDVDDPPAGRGSGRLALARRDYARALAWWGARMAEALEHAHEKGVLHRDVKPSNVLVTADGMPMLLDFNLAVVPALDAEAAVPGGTLDYMAPEQIDELAGVPGARVDARSDVYGLGVLLDEALRGARPFPPPRGANSGSDFLHRAAEDRRRGAPRLRATRPEVPAALEAVVRRCLAPDPNDRYASAADLAHDLQAVADDRPLRFAAEPWRERAFRWTRRHGRSLATAAVVVAALVVTTGLLVRERIERNRRAVDVKAIFDKAAAFETAGDLEQARVLFDSASRLAERPETTAATLRRASGTTDDLSVLRQKARARYKLAERALANRQAALNLETMADPLRFRLIGYGGDLKAAASELEAALRPFHVDDTVVWTRRPDLVEGLDQARLARLAGTVDELLFLYVLALDRQGDRGAWRRGLEICVGALRFVEPAGPWLALRARLTSRLGGEDDATPLASCQPDDPGRGARECFLWGALRLVEKQPEEALRWLKQAVKLDEGNYWYQFYLGFAHDRAVSVVFEALRHYDAAVALQPRSPYVRFTRARLYRVGNSWDLARAEFERALADYQGLPDRLRDQSFEAQARLELGLVKQSLGEFGGARAEYATVLKVDPVGEYARAARLNLAKLDVDAVAFASARAIYDGLLAVDPKDQPARRGRALLALREGAPARVEADLDVLLAGDLSPGERADVLASRALSRLALGRAAEALTDAEAADRLKPTASSARLRTRARLALGQIDALELERPEDVETLPAGGVRLRDDLRRLVPALRVAAAPALAFRQHATLAVVLAALGESNAVVEADRLVALAPVSPRGYRVRAHIFRYQGRLDAARADAEHALSLDPGDPRLWDLRGEIALSERKYAAALADFEHALALGGEGALRSHLAAAHLAVGDASAAVADWTLALARDPDDPRFYLGRAEAFLAMAQWDQALADLEQATAWADSRPAQLVRILAVYVRCLPHRPQQWPRFVVLIGRACRSPR